MNFFLRFLQNYMSFSTSANSIPCERMVLKIRQKILMISIASYSVLFAILNCSYAKPLISSQILNLIYLILLNLSILCWSKTHSKINNVILFIFLAVYSTGSIFLNPSGILLHIINSTLHVFLTLFITQSYLSVLAIIIFQLCLMNFFAKDILIYYLQTSPLEEITSILIQASFFICILQLPFLVGMKLVLSYSVKILKESSKREKYLSYQKELFLTISHEIRNPVNALLGNLTLAIDEKNINTLLNHLKTANACGELILQLVNNLLDHEKNELGNLEITPRPVGTQELFQKIWDVCSSIIHHKNLKGVLKISKAMPESIKVDEHRIMQILMNLVGNAIKFTDSGQVTVKVNWFSGHEIVDDKCFEPQPFSDDEGLFEKSECFATTNEDEFFCSFNSLNWKKCTKSPFQTIALKGVLKISVKDTGCGMDEETVASVFDKFKQGSNDTSRSKLGSGLGLYITKQLCLQMKGDIRAYSKPNKGSVFILCIPINQ